MQGTTVARNLPPTVPFSITPQDRILFMRQLTTYAALTGQHHAPVTPVTQTGSGSNLPASLNLPGAQNPLNNLTTVTVPPKVVPQVHEPTPPPTPTPPPPARHRRPPPPAATRADTAAAATATAAAAAGDADTARHRHRHRALVMGAKTAPLPFPTMRGASSRAFKNLPPPWRGNIFHAPSKNIYFFLVSPYDGGSPLWTRPTKPYL